jgi:hypothetical protein
VNNRVPACQLLRVPTPRKWRELEPTLAVETNFNEPRHRTMDQSLIKSDTLTEWATMTRATWLLVTYTSQRLSNNELRPPTRPTQGLGPSKAGFTLMSRQWGIWISGRMKWVCFRLFASPLFWYVDWQWDALPFLSRNLQAYLHPAHPSRGLHVPAFLHTRPSIRNLHHLFPLGFPYFRNA